MSNKLCALNSFFFFFYNDILVFNVRFCLLISLELDKFIAFELSQQNYVIYDLVIKLKTKNSDFGYNFYLNFVAARSMKNSNKIIFVHGVYKSTLHLQSV